MNNVISLYPIITEVKNSKDISLDTFLQHVKDGRWQDEIIALRLLKDDKEIKSAKEKLPYVTISGKFKQRNNEGIEKHSGFICMDIDHVDNVNDAKAEICCDNYFYAVFISCSGRGLCALAKINPKAHDESFNFLSEHLYQKYNLNIDEKCKDVSRPRFISFDPDIYINENSQLCPVKPETKKQKPVNVNYVFQENDFTNIVNQITNSKIDLTSDYSAWIKIGFGLANKFGESGRNYFHAISQYNENYNFEKADKKFTHLLRTGANKVTIGFVYYLAKQRGLTIYSEKTQNIIRTAIGVQKTDAVEKPEQVKKYLKQLDGFTDDEIKEAEPLIDQVLSQPVVGNDDNIILDIKMFIKQNYTLRKNIISRNIELELIPIDDETLNSIFIHCRTYIKSATKDLITSIIFSDFIPKYNPFAELIQYYIDNPPKVKRGHIAKLLSCIETDTDNHELFIKKWLIALIASLNGKHSPLLLCFCGSQNTGKTHFFRHLLPDSLSKYYAESKLDAGKDDEILMTKKLIIVDDEMGGKSKLEQRKLKELTSKQVFSIREPYGRVSCDLNRLAMLGGTTNDEEILSDPTGNRRILPIRILSIDRDIYNSVNKDLLFFECFLEYENGYDFNLNSEEIIKLNDSTHVFKQSSTEEELVSKYFAHPDDKPGFDIVEKTNSEILSYIQQNSQVKLSQTKLGLVLKQMGFSQTHKKINKTTIRVYDVVEVFGNATVEKENRDSQIF